jgi:transposase-like protein
MDARNEAQRLYQEEHLSPSEIADKLNIKSGTVRAWKKRYNWDNNCNVTDDFVTLKNPNPEAKRKRHERAQKKIVAIIEAADLTEREKNLCIAYISGGNAYQAAVEAGYTGSYNTIKNTAWEVLGKPHIIAELKRLKEIKKKMWLADGDDLDEYHRRLAFSDITQFIEIKKGGSVRLKKSDNIDGQLIKKISWGKTNSIELKDSGRSLDYLERYCRTKPMDKHKIDYDNKRLSIEERKIDNGDNDEDDGVVIINDLKKGSPVE